MAAEKPETTTSKGRAPARLPLIVVGLLAAGGGLVLPQLVPGDTVTASAPVMPTAKEDGKSTGSLRYQPPAWPEPPSQQGMLVRLATGTVVVLALCVGCLWYGRRWLVGPTPGAAAKGEMRLVETMHLGQRCCLHLVQLANRQVLIGTDVSGIRTVVPLPDAFDETLGRAEAGTTPEGAASRA